MLERWRVSSCCRGVNRHIRLDLREVFERRRSREDPARRSTDGVDGGELRSFGVGELVDNDAVEAVEMGSASVAKFSDDERPSSTHEKMARGGAFI
jgi:hypothetical protein